jgi:hypothetical protein
MKNILAPTILALLSLPLLSFAKVGDSAEDYLKAWFKERPEWKIIYKGPNPNHPEMALYVFKKAEEIEGSEWYYFEYGSRSGKITQEGFFIENSSPEHILTETEKLKSRYGGSWHQVCSTCPLSITDDAQSNGYVVIDLGAPTILKRLPINLPSGRWLMSWHNSKCF